MNYLFIACDQLRFDTLSVNGNDICKTPYLDQLAKEGANFTNAYTTAALCSPARASIFTGNYAFKHGMGTNCDMYHSLSAELKDPSKLLHNKLLQENYRCGFIGKWHVGTNLGPCDLGFEGMNVPGYGNCKVEPSFKEYLKENNLEYKIENEIHFNPNNQTLFGGVWNGEDKSTTDWYLTNRTIDLIDDFKKDGDKFFVTCQYWGPHGPHLPPIDWVGKADRNKIVPPKSYKEDLSSKPQFVARHLDFYRNPPKNWEECREVIGLYYDYMMFIDNQIGRIINHLKEIGEYDNTVILFTCDHGDLQFAHNGLIGKGFLYNEVMKIPLIMRHPNKANGIVCDKFTSNMDVMPTILDDAGIEYDCDGESLLAHVNGEIAERNSLLMEFHGINYLFTQRAIIDKDKYKLFFTPGGNDELYDLNADPDEINNLYDNPEYAKKQEEMIELLKRESVRYRDPVMDYTYKINGEWCSPSGQVDASNSVYNKV